MKEIAQKQKKKKKETREPWPKKETTEPWPPQWKPIMESPQFARAMINPYMFDWDLELLDPVDNAKEFIQQLRESRGYDIDRPGPRYLGCPFWPLPPSRWYSDKYLMDKVKFAFDEINTQAKKYDEYYELKDLVKVVEANPQSCDLFTFNVREIVPNTENVKTVQAMVFTHTYESFKLIEWRFRPGPPLTPSETSSDSSSDDSPRGHGTSTISVC